MVLGPLHWLNMVNWRKHSCASTKGNLQNIWEARSQSNVTSILGKGQVRAAGSGAHAGGGLQSI